jgi:hypothetical protein
LAIVVESSVTSGVLVYVVWGGHVLFICSYICLLLLVGDSLGAVVLSVSAVEAQVVAVEVAV